MKARWIHVDINSYFATLLQQENPLLRGKPVGILKGAGRTCVIAASKEAKKLGVRTGCRKRDALELAPNIIFVPAEFDLYLDATKRLKALFESLTPHVEVFSLDEAFLDLSDCSQLYPDAHVFGRMIQKKIKEELGEWVTCNVGISYNRLLSKLASEVSEKGSVVEITPENRDIFLTKTQFSQVCGVGYRLEKRLRRFGVTCPYLINFMSDELLLTHFGPFWSKELRKIGQGEESSLLEKSDRHQPMKSVGRSITGYQLCDDEERIRQVIRNLIEEVVYKARRLKMAGRYVAIGLKGEDHSYWNAHRTLQYSIQHSSEMFDVIYNQLYKSWKRNFKIIRFSVQLGMLEFSANLNESLLPQWQRQEKLSQATDAITKKYGLFTLYPGTLLRTKVIRPEVTGFLGDKQYQFM